MKLLSAVFLLALAAVVSFAALSSAASPPLEALSALLEEEDRDEMNVHEHPSGSGEEDEDEQEEEPFHEWEDPKHEKKVVAPSLSGEEPADPAPAKPACGCVAKPSCACSGGAEPKKEAGGSGAVVVAKTMHPVATNTLQPHH